METISDLLKKEPINETFKASALAILQASGDFKHVGTDNEVIIIELKKEILCECCGLPERFCDEHDELFV